MSVFVSTRNRSDQVDARLAMVRGLSSDGGLYVPTAIPHINYKDLIGLSYSQIAQRIVHAWFDDLSEDDIARCCDGAYRHFDDARVAPVVKAGDTFILELFHGETCAFKDVALSLLPRLLVKSLQSLGINKKIMILTATSGDTGSAAMNGFKNVPNTGIITFFPNGGVSPLQRRQMVSMEGDNLTACAVNGNFDDCQSAVKKAFAELPEQNDVRFSSANSINIARLVPQISYYFSSYIDLMNQGHIRADEKLSFIVPTGNFGDILAGYYAKAMGLPVEKLICASNANNVLTDFIASGVYDRRRQFLKTFSPSMDILISSNLERLLYHTEDSDATLVAKQMEELKSDGYYSVDSKTFKQIQSVFSAYCFDDDATLHMIKSFYSDCGYLADPHTAVALAAEKAFRRDNPGQKCAVLSTASPYKFISCIVKALGLSEKNDVFETAKMISDITGTAIPAHLSCLSAKAELHTDVIEKEDITSYILRKYPDLI